MRHERSFILVEEPYLEPYSARVKSAIWFSVSVFGVLCWWAIISLTLRVFAS